MWNTDTFYDDGKFKCRAYDPKMNPGFKEPWFSKSVGCILKEHMGIQPNPELVKAISSMIDNSTSGTDIWYFIYGFNNSEIMFIINNFKIDIKDKQLYKTFFEKTKDLSNQKEIALKWVEHADLDKAILECKKESFDLLLLDFLDGKITEEKMLNWGVGQVMKQYPKRFAPAEVMAALKQRFIL